MKDERRAGLWRTITPLKLRQALHPFLTYMAGRKALQVLKAGEAEPVEGPLIVSGLFGESKGISMAAQLTVLGLRHAGLEPVEHDAREVLDLGVGANSKFPVDEAGGVWLIHLNPPEALHLLTRLDPAGWKGRYRIGYWAWELTVAPASWVRASEVFHEIWVPSEFVADALRSSGVTTPIRIMPHPVALSEERGLFDRERFGLDADAFCVLAMGDLNSSASRKNLMGAIEAYKMAFPVPSRDQALVVKTISDAQHPEFAAAVADVRRARSDIVFVTEPMAHGDVLNLIASCDVYFSPHRSEGFGLPSAEALLCGVPALATGWSGNMAFMSGLDELLIKSSPTTVDDPSGVYKSGVGQWAEPDIEDAAMKLQRLQSDPEMRRATAELGRLRVVELNKAWSEDLLVGTPLMHFVGADQKKP